MKLNGQVAILGLLAAATAAVAAWAAATSAAGAGYAQRHGEITHALHGGLTQPYVTLGTGTKGRVAGSYRYRWTVTAHGREGRLPVSRLDRRRPCLEVGIAESEGDSIVVEETGGCYPEPGYLTAKGEPLIAVNWAPRRADTPALTAIGIAFAPVVTVLEAVFPDGSVRAIPLRQLSPAQARKIGRIRFRYTAFAVSGRWCPSRLVARNAAGEALWESEEAGCLRGLEE
jgi:hypothetical protein